MFKTKKYVSRAMRGVRAGSGTFLACVASILFSAMALAPTSASAANLQEISIGYQPIVNGPLWIARHEGYFEKLGLKVNWVKFVSGPAQFAALQGGRINIAWGGVGTFMGVYANGADIRLIAPLEDYNGVEGLAVPKTSKIKRPADISGHTVALTKASDGDFGLQKLMENKGIKPSTVKVLYMDTPQQVAAFLNGNIDAAFTWPPFLNQLEAHGAQVIYRNSALKAGPGILGWVAKADWLAENKSVVTRLLAAWDEGLKTMKKHPELAAKYTNEYTGMSVESAGAVQKNLRYFDARGMITKGSPVYFGQGSALHLMLEDFAKFGVDRGVMKVKPDPDKYVDVSYQKAYAATLK
jgi:ABC-type nitrate/sulfonate/bicarbonate transport system substrate-binding protein